MEIKNIDNMVQELLLKEFRDACPMLTNHEIEREESPRGVIIRSKALYKGSIISGETFITNDALNGSILGVQSQIAQLWAVINNEMRENGQYRY